MIQTKKNFHMANFRLNKILILMVLSLLTSVASLGQTKRSCGTYVREINSKKTASTEKLLFALRLYDDSTFVEIQLGSGFPRLDKVSCGRWTQRNDTLFFYSDSRYINHPKLLNSGSFDYFIDWTQYNGLPFVILPDASIICAPYHDARLAKKSNAGEIYIKPKLIQSYSMGRRNRYVILLPHGKDFRNIEWRYRLLDDENIADSLIEIALSILEMPQSR